jgi:hypothetical protein
MADEDSIFAQAGFDIPRAEKKSVPTSSEPATSIFESAGFKLPTGKVEDVPVPSSSWKDAEALENLTAQGNSSTAALAKAVITGAKVDEKPPAKPGRGMQQALLDYIPHVLSGVKDTLATPGNTLASDNPTTTNALVAPALGLATLATGGEFPRVGAVAAANKIAPSSSAVNRLVEAIGPENVPSVVNRLKENPRLTIADASDPVRTMTQGLIDPAQPKVQNLVSERVKERHATLPEAVNSAYTEAMGPAPNVVHMVEGLKDRARKAGSEAIQPALANAKPVDVSPVIKAIDEKLKPGVTALMGDTKLPLSELEQELVRFKSRLSDGENQIFDPQKLHRIQSDIGDQAFQLSKSPNPKDRMLGSQLRGFNEKLIDQIDASSGGAYRPAREKFKDAKDIHEAFDSGFDTLKNRAGVKGLEDRPEALNEWMKTATPEEVVARRLGTRADIDQKIKSAKNQALAGESITRIEYNQEKLKTLFGDKEAGRLIRVLKDAQDEAATNAKLMAGSKTAETLAGQKALEVRKVGGGNPLQYFGLAAAEMLGQGAGLPGVGTALSLAAKGTHMAGQKGMQLHDLARNFEFAKNALASGPTREAAIERLLSHPKVVRQLKKSSNALTAP